MTYPEVFAFGIFLAAGLYLILCDLLHMPTAQATKAALKLTHGKKVRWYHGIMLRCTESLSKHIKINKYRRRELTATLKYAGIETSPETYIARIAVRAFSRLLFIIPCIWIAPILIPVIIILTVNRIWDDTKYAGKIAAEKRKAIERELPRFVSTVAQEIGETRDVLSILEGYRESARDVFKSELDITIAGMKSGSQEQALIRLAGRVGSGMLSEVVRGLLTVLRGGNGQITFALLNHDYKKMEIQTLKKEALKRPGKMKKYSYLLLACIMATYIYATFQQVLGNIKGLF